MDVWSINEKLKMLRADVIKDEQRISHIESYLKELSIDIEKINAKLGLINKASDERVSDKKDKSSSVRAKRSTAKKS